MSPIAKKLYLYFWAFSIISGTQGSRPRPRTQKKSEAKAKDSSSDDIPSRGQGPRTQAQVFKCSGNIQKKRLPKILFWQFTKFQQFKKYCCPRSKDRVIFEEMKLRDQGQGLQNVSSRTSLRPRSSSRTPRLHNIIRKSV